MQGSYPSYIKDTVSPISADESGDFEARPCSREEGHNGKRGVKDIQKTVQSGIALLDIQYNHTAEVEIQISAVPAPDTLRPSRIQAWP